MIRMYFVGVLVGFLGGCGTLPALNSSPVGGNQEPHCRWVREQVADGAMPIDVALQWYEYCGPFVYPSGGGF
jgi:hypothetical protein